MHPSKTVKLYRGSSYLLMLGVIHSALTPLFYKFLSPDGMWFFGTGLTLVFLCLLNIAASKLLDKWLLKTTLAANFIGTSFSILIVIVLHEPQAFIGLLFHIIVFTVNLLVWLQQNRNYEIS